jgi:hypothetical protein
VAGFFGFVVIVFFFFFFFFFYYFFFCSFSFVASVKCQGSPDPRGRLFRGHVNSRNGCIPAASFLCRELYDEPAFLRPRSRPVDAPASRCSTLSRELHRAYSRVTVSLVSSSSQDGGIGRGGKAGPPGMSGSVNEESSNRCAMRVKRIQTARTHVPSYFPLAA